jgi:hypothetical protein
MSEPTKTESAWQGPGKLLMRKSKPKAIPHISGEGVASSSTSSNIITETAKAVADSNSEEKIWIPIVTPLTKDLDDWLASFKITETDQFKAFQLELDDLGVPVRIFLPKNFQNTTKVSGKVLMHLISALQVPTQDLLVECNNEQDPKDLSAAMAGVYSAIQSNSLPTVWKSPQNPRDIGFLGVQYLRLLKASKTEKGQFPLNFVAPDIKGDFKQERRFNTVFTMMVQSWSHCEGRLFSKAFKYLLNYLINHVESKFSLVPVYEKHPLEFTQMCNAAKRHETKRDKKKGVIVKTIDPWNPLNHPLVDETDKNYIRSRYRNAAGQVLLWRDTWADWDTATRIKNYFATCKSLKNTYNIAYEESNRATTKIGRRFANFKSYIKHNNLMKGKDIKLDSNVIALYWKEVNKPTDEWSMAFIKSTFIICTDADKNIIVDTSQKLDEDNILKAVRTELVLFGLLDMLKKDASTATIETFNYFDPLKGLNRERPGAPQGASQVKES